MDNPHFAAQIGQLLAEVSRSEVASGRPMLSSIVVSKDTSLPGSGFFKLAQELRRASPLDDEMRFVVEEIKRTHAYWQACTPARIPSSSTGPDLPARYRRRHGGCFRAGAQRWPLTAGLDHSAERTSRGSGGTQIGHLVLAGREGGGRYARSEVAALEGALAGIPDALS